MKKLVTLTASALLMASFATGASAATTDPVTGTTTTETAPETTPTTVEATVVGTTNPNTADVFQSMNNSYYFALPSSWDESVKYEEFTATQLTSMNESGNYLARFTYQPQYINSAGNTNPVQLAEIRGYATSVWNSITNKTDLGTVLKESGDTVYVLKTFASTQLSAETDVDRFNTLITDISDDVPAGFTLGAAPSQTTPPATTGPVLPATDPDKVSTNPTPTIDLTSMTPFYKSPGGTMIGYLGPQKLDTTGNGTTDPASGQWVEIYTWMGLAWIVVE